MTLSSETRLVRYQGNSATTAFPYTFLILSEDDVIVKVYNSDDFTTTTLAASEYTIDGIGEDTFGEVTYPLSGSPLSAVQFIIIVREVPYTQDTDIPNQSAFLPEVLEEQLDRIVMQTQQLAERSSRSLLLLEGDSFENTLPAKVDLAGQMLAFDLDGEPTVGAPSTATVADFAQFVADAEAAAALAQAAAASVKRPDQYGVLDFVSASLATRATTNTAIFALMFADIEDGDRIECHYPDTIHLNGGALSLTGKSRLTFDFRGSIFQNRNDFSYLFVLTSCSGEWYGGDYYGYAHIDILVPQAPTEFNGASSSGNGAGIIYMATPGQFKFNYLNTFHNAGQDIFITDPSGHIEFRGCNFSGIGQAYIDPIDNGVDFGVSCYQTITPYKLGRDMPSLSVFNCIFKDSAFGLLAAAVKLHFEGNKVLSAWGQHGVYYIEPENAIICNNSFEDCQQIGIKLQLENYAGTVGGAAWATLTAYAVGDERINSATLYECLTAHTSGTFATDLAAVKWRVSPKMQRRGVVIEGNTARRCGTAIGVINNIGSAKEAYIEGLVCKGNSSFDGQSAALANDDYLFQRCLRSIIEGNSSERGGSYGMRCSDFSGIVKGNLIGNSYGTALIMSLAGDTYVEDNVLRDAGLLTGTAGDRYPFQINAAGATVIPSADTTPYLLFRGNDIRFTTGDAASATMGEIGTGVVADIYDTTTNSSKALNCAGTVNTDDRNQPTVT